MSERAKADGEIVSPCVRICMIHPDARICVGCYRTADEIARWTAMGPEARARVMEDLGGREDLLKRRKGGVRRRRAG